MAPENKNGKAQRFDTKQKLMFVVFVVVILVIIWQVMGLFGGGAKTPSPTPTLVQKTTNSVPTTKPTPAPMPQQSQTNVTNKEILSPIDSSVLEAEKQAQKKYLDLLNQLQMLKMQRDIAETNQAIASAKLATITAEKGVSDLLTTPAPTPAPVIVPPGAYSNALANPTPSGTSVLPPTNQPTQTPPPTSPIPPPPNVALPEVQYSVISVSMQLGKWTAVIGYQGSLYSVSIGDILPADKSTVVSINRNAVVLQKEGKRRRISILSTI